MKQNLIRLSQGYVTALRKHLRHQRGANLQPALRLGRRAVTLGLETLELARVHEQALTQLELCNSKDGLIKRAREFFSQAIIPIVETRQAGRQSRIDLRRLNKTLTRRTTELAAMSRQLERGIARREGVEKALKLSGAHYARLLKDSLRLQQELRQLTHRLLAAQEVERKQLSCELQDKVAQTLVGINVRLLTLKKETRTNTKDLQIKIASTQRLIVNSAKSVRQFARQFRCA